MTGHKRNLERKINKLLGLFPIVAIIGPRQCGKSTLAKNLLPDWRYIDLEREDDLRLVSQDTRSFLERYPTKLIIDEAQELPQLFKELRGVIDSARDLRGRYVITGSSSPEIIKGLDESLAGRVAIIELAPFKANELYQKPLSPLYELISSKTTIDGFLDLKPHLTQTQIYDHWFLGGYPEPGIMGQKDESFIDLWKDNYFASYIRRDILKLFPKLNSQRFRTFIQTIAFHSGTILKNTSIAAPVGVSSTTIKDYLDIVHNTFIWRNIHSYEGNSLKQVQKMPKGFFRDQGLLHYQLKLKSIDDLLLHPQAGRSFESFIIEELINGFQAIVESNIDYYFYRTRDKSEIDLIIEAPFGVIPVKIKLGKKVNNSMLLGLRTFLEDTKVPYGILINNGSRVELLDEKIVQIPATCI